MGNSHGTQTPTHHSNKQNKAVGSEASSTFQTPPHFNPLDPRSPLKNRTPISEFHTPQRNNNSNDQPGKRLHIVATHPQKSSESLMQQSPETNRNSSKHLDFSSPESDPRSPSLTHSRLISASGVHRGAKERTENASFQHHLAQTVNADEDYQN
jgi:hypothetical protein